MAAEIGRARSRPGALTGFNEAAALWPRKCGHDGPARAQRHASMRPRLYGRGNSAHGGYRASPVEASMRPRLYGRGNTVTSVRTETFRLASMRPRLYGRGNSIISILFKCQGSCHTGASDATHRPEPIMTATNNHPQNAENKIFPLRERSPTLPRQPTARGPSSYALRKAAPPSYPPARNAQASPLSEPGSHHSPNGSIRSGARRTATEIRAGEPNPAPPLIP